jgi:hypothetical protein
MKISKAHEEFARLLHYHYDYPKQEVLDHPENYLGPNWGEVINFWLFLDTLNKKQLKVVEERYSAVIYKERRIARDKALVAAGATTKYIYSARTSACNTVFLVNYAAGFATYELIGLDKLLDQGHQPLFFPLFLNL